VDSWDQDWEEVENPADHTSDPALASSE
jgi:hypothetical protein